MSTTIYCYHCRTSHPKEDMRQVVTKTGKRWRCIHSIRAAKVGQHRLQITGQGEGVADAVRREIEVVPDGRRVEQVLNGTLTPPASVKLDLPVGRRLRGTNRCARGRQGVPTAWTTAASRSANSTRIRTTPGEWN